ncbi:adenosylcobinamide-GDP ribazoletransferase [Novosphingobium capsulatum]|uniref:Adenosylcobinamide-GDP ribazoletransferase n=1 Tax=Novosphingobium capsulatum TaxID=13688 RepID=A0ABU1MFR6_9SPHN|nr:MULTISPECIES: adenosylcobinamide-GDP ribazoletransferase [Novosphingobium]MDR6509185.1 adenosylcobinamide-GDP ribazoletransferase [Novosphingobium capsulatum]PTR07564.1 cobalamin-5'-phosphate synthase [Novosphingobium sp. GV055]PUB00266.1 cobalamin-5'-phosphate synthase [Novosphingobium sp. GV061]PUB15307.1 cobalamin-5'-phosphate synthase [Novosphingobium sp. GV079]PUB39183.1 cobalamin-5'-phosphate synthase [Novosphingobium sp. GV027]
MKGLILATQFLTRLPMPRVAAEAGDFAASMRWFPAVGVIVGGCVAGAVWAGGWLDPWIGAMAGLAAWVVVTGALHLDGLADLADASGAAHRDRARLLAVLADPHLGSFGVVAVVMQLMAKLVLLHALVAQGMMAGIVWVPFAARLGPLAWARWLPPLHAGLGARFAGVVRRRDLVLWAGALALAAWWYPALLIAVPGMALWGWWLKVRIGGISGDGHGAGIEWNETVLLLALCIGGRLWG